MGKGLSTFESATELLCIQDDVVGGARLVSVALVDLLDDLM